MNPPKLTGDKWNGAQVVAKPQARQAILAFMQTGELDSEQEWEES